MGINPLDLFLFRKHMKKTYRSKLHGYNIYVKVDGKLKNVDFERSFIGRGSLIGCSYATDDKAVQQAIESHADFGVKFWTDDVEKKETPTKEAPVKEEETMEKRSRKLIKE